MTRAEFLLAGQFFLDAHEVHGFKAYEVSDVGRVHRSGTVLQAPPPNAMRNALTLIEEGLLWIRNVLAGESPVHVSSWYRDPQYNAAVGGATHSIHLIGGAADIRKSGLTPRALATEIDQRHPLRRKMGIGLYRSFVHVDVRGLLGREAPARWSGRGVERWWR